jgi:hypothetical protein
VITQALISLLVTPIAWMIGLLPTFSLPDFLGTGGGSIASGMTGFFGYIGSFTNWLPGYALAPAFAWVATCVAVAIGVKLVRIVASFLTFGGGSAA